MRYLPCIFHCSLQSTRQLSPVTPPLFGLYFPRLKSLFFFSKVHGLETNQRKRVSLRRLHCSRKNDLNQGADVGNLTKFNKLAIHWIQPFFHNMPVQLRKAVICSQGDWGVIKWIATILIEKMRASYLKETNSWSPHPSHRLHVALTHVPCSETSKIWSQK